MSNFSSHVYSLKLPMAASPTLDTICGAMLAICLLFGTIFNLLALIYFTNISGRKSLAEKLYTVVSAVDLCTCLSQTPVMLSLLTGGRDPVFFDNQLFCAAWVIVFEYLQRCSIFLVMLLSITRTIAITFPFYKIRSKMAMFSLLPYTCIMATSLIVGIICFNQTFIYFTDYSYAIKVFLTNPPTSAETMFNLIENNLYNIEILAPSLIIFISFIISLLKMKECQSVSKTSHQKIHQASLTVALFTLIFLILNLPFFVVLTCLTVDSIVASYPGPVFTKWFMHWHAFPLSKVVLVVLNASLNPVLYSFRMVKFTRWLKVLITCTKDEIVASTSGVSQARVAERRSLHRPNTASTNSTHQLSCSWQRMPSKQNCKTAV